MDLHLRGTLALAAGSTAGIGEVIARTLASEGTEVVVHGRTGAAGVISGAIVARGGAALVALGGLGSDAAVADVVCRVREARRPGRWDGPRPGGNLQGRVA